ncbi:PKD domain-containing protein [candidate division KSB1 bacterium]|nr:PKD domain-containing protein [candidate division KSB1 bacterium]
MRHFSMIPKFFLLIILLLVIFCSKENSTEPDSTPRTVANFKMEMSDNIVPVNVSFINQSKEADSFRWEFGDSTFSTDENAMHLYETAGSYSIKLVAIGEKGSDSLVSVLELIDPPVEIFLNIGAARIKLGDPFSKVVNLHGNDFTETQHSGVNSYYWLIEYKSKGLAFWTDIVTKEELKLTATITMINVQSPYKGITQESIGIGSSRSDVLAAYSGVYEGPNYLHYRVGTSYFEFKDDKVRGIQIDN